MTLSITVGKGRKNPRGSTVPISAGMSPARWLAEALSAQPPDVESWWSVHTWRDSHRKGEGWISAAGAGIDVDYIGSDNKHSIPPPEISEAIKKAAIDGKLPGSVFHLTPRGFRVIFIFKSEVTDKGLFIGASRFAAEMVSKCLASLGLTNYVVDEKALCDTARFLYSPNSVVDNVARNHQLYMMRDESFDAAALRPAQVKLKPVPSIKISDAISRYCSEHRREFPKNSAPCPVCGGSASFGALAGNPDRWSCFSASHTVCGIKGGLVWHGDVLDLDAYEAGIKPMDLLSRDGYLSSVVHKQSNPPPTPFAPRPVELPGIRKSYASLCEIFRQDRNAHALLPDGLRWNEMACCPSIGAAEYEDYDTGKLREKIELNVLDSKGKGLEFGAVDIENAVIQVAHEDSYHPVRDYLNSLTWDNHTRIINVAEDILGVDNNELNGAMLRKWFISAVARAMKPGCKVDTVLVLTGNQGIHKSTFFQTITGSQWFSDQNIDIENKDALLLLQRVWIYEWAELAQMQRARDHETLRSFVSSSHNDFRPPFGRKTIRAPRHCVFVGTDNKKAILNDPTGSRRYWPIEIPQNWKIPLDKVRDWRDQLWAEAMQAYRAGEQWWLTEHEENLLAAAQGDFQDSHPWEETIADWLPAWAFPVTTAAIRAHAICKPVWSWTRADEMAVAKCMKALGYVQERRSINGERSRIWIPK